MRIFFCDFWKKMLIVHVRLEYLLVNYYDVPVDSTKDKVSVSGSISQGKDFFIDFLESFLIDDSVGTLLLKGSVEGTYFSCNELKWATVVQIHLGYNNVQKIRNVFEWNELCLKNMYFCAKKLLFEHFFVNCKMKMAFLKQFFLCSNLFSKLEKNCLKVGNSLLQWTKNVSNATF